MKGGPARRTPWWVVFPGMIGIGLPMNAPQPAGACSSAKSFARSSIVRNSQLRRRPCDNDSGFGQLLNIRLAVSAEISSISNPVCCDPLAVAPPAGIRMQCSR